MIHEVFYATAFSADRKWWYLSVDILAAWVILLKNWAKLVVRKGSNKGYVEEQDQPQSFCTRKSFSAGGSSIGSRWILIKGDSKRITFGSAHPCLRTFFCPRFELSYRYRPEMHSLFHLSLFLFLLFLWHRNKGWQTVIIGIMFS